MSLLMFCCEQKLLVTAVAQNFAGSTNILSFLLRVIIHNVGTQPTLTQLLTQLLLKYVNV